MTRWFSDASALTRYGIATVNYGTSTGLLDTVQGRESGDRRALVKTAEVYARAAMTHLRGGGVKLVTFGDGAGGSATSTATRSSSSTCATMREWFERGGADETGERVPLAETRLRAPIVPKKFFHTAGNFREHEEESKRVGWSHEIAPWIVFFQNVDAIVGPDEPGDLPRAPDRGARLRARARGRR